MTRYIFKKIGITWASCVGKFLNIPATNLVVLTNVHKLVVHLMQVIKSSFCPVAPTPSYAPLFLTLCLPHM
jgi:hypothetical protein